ncbi:MAG: pyridoxal phosphate-dependent aminotransferase [Acidobacteria bacterium]|nr:pyridoxal phosphate-dependent aminotransferase [Acidobacteriota bacterium]
MTRTSARLPGSLVPNRLSEAVTRRRAGGEGLADLTQSNPTRAGLAYPPDLLMPLASADGLVYEPQPFGMTSAREAVVADYWRRGITVGVDRVCLTASTSEAYAWLFKLLCDPGDRVLVPRPSYPLFEHLTALECVEASPYELDLHGHWRIDVDALARQVDERTKAVLVVSPNNPTGSVLERAELDALADVCAASDLVLIGDEVFADYRLDGQGPAPSVLDQDRAVAVSLGGLSKSIGLPQVKVAWMALGGPTAPAARVLAGLEIVADAFLSVSTPAQVALPRLLADGAAIRDTIRRRTARNLTALAAAVAAVPAVTLRPPAGGWCAVLQVPALQNEEALVLDLVERDGVLVHPGYFFDFPREAFLVVSLLVEPDVFDTAMARVLARVEEVA